MMIKKSQLLRTIDPCLKVFGLFGFPNVFIPKQPNRMEKFSIVFAIFKFIIALGILADFIHDSLGQLEILYTHKNISIHIINHVANSLPAIISLVQSAVMVPKFNRILRRLAKVDELFSNFLHLETKWERVWWRLLSSGEWSDGSFFVFSPRFLLVALGSLAMFVACSGYVGLSAIHVNPSIWPLVIYFYIPFILGCVSALRFCLLVQILTIFYEEAAESLEKSIRNRELAVSAEDWKWQMKANYHKLLVLRRVHLLLWQSSLLINECFGFGLLSLFAMFFMSSIYRGFLLCEDVVTGKSRDQRQFIGLLQILFAIVIVHFHCEKCSKSVIMR
jgi:hypothetical protein